jgi:hypothetical protein
LNDPAATAVSTILCKSAITIVLLLSPASPEIPKTNVVIGEGHGHGAR